MAHTSRRSLSLALLGLVGSGLAAASVVSPPAHAAPEDFVERWCGVGVERPCIESVTFDGVARTAADSEVLVTGRLTNPDFDYFFVEAVEPTPTLSQEWEIVVDSGSMKPTTTWAYAGAPDVDRYLPADGSYRLRYTGRPVQTAFGCQDVYPAICPATATEERIMLQIEVQERSDEFVGFDTSQNVDGANGVWLETAPDGSRFLFSEMYNAHYMPDGTTLFEGEVRFRMPYAMLRDSFGVPNPETMVASSLSGTVNGSTTAATFLVQHDPDGGGLIIDISNLHFSTKRVRVKRGVIVPTRPTYLAARRTAPQKGRLTFDPARPRGARVTGYQAQCVNRAGHKISVTGSASPVVVEGLKAGKSYECKVAAKSRAGLGPWSTAKKLPARP